MLRYIEIAIFLFQEWESKSFDWFIPNKIYPSAFYSLHKEEFTSSCRTDEGFMKQQWKRPNIWLYLFRFYADVVSAFERTNWADLSKEEFCDRSPNIGILHVITSVASDTKTSKIVTKFLLSWKNNFDSPNFIYPKRMTPLKKILKTKGDPCP